MWIVYFYASQQNSALASVAVAEVESVVVSLSLASAAAKLADSLLKFAT